MCLIAGMVYAQPSEDKNLPGISDIGIALNSEPIDILFDTLSYEMPSDFAAVFWKTFENPQDLNLQSEMEYRTACNCFNNYNDGHSYSGHEPTKSENIIACISCEGSDSITSAGSVLKCPIDISI